jgi:imidazoleglycerol-phosphate dehydratase
MERKAAISRTTKETDISLKLNIDGKGKEKIQIEPGFWKHMIELFTFFSGFDIELKAKGDDQHHLLEDIGICFGQAFTKAIGEKKGIKRFGNILLPMDETLVRIALDISGRPYLSFNVDIERSKEEYSYLENAQEFVKGFVNHAGITMHIDLIRGENLHHIIEGIFKGLGISIKQSVKLSGEKITSTKGKID